ncbi:Thioredoxin [Thioalkalivibrio nitratireducens DSM 14787]|uniref:Thioredoxin n=1 Tax=Thioalkalivibrio nitratireducens (strain DSM 14787 / UNIQEM 213 / ALEN2) TaxID=1255043 RepID=L0E0W1_THIND|nr:thioredoxin [Thioalkalivibrio nitratireducens]AGA34291.1 Thioredoxin [Thioalkalivibrio nitratireducens DSM 14787]
MAVQELTQENFESTVTGNDIVIVDFWAPWCAPCRSFAPIFEAASENYQDVVFAKVNTEEQQALAAAFQIRSIPTLMIFREQVIIFSQPGMLSASQLEDVLGKARELDMAQVHEDIRRQQQAAGNGGA